MTNAERVQAEIKKIEAMVAILDRDGLEDKEEQITLAALRVCKALEEWKSGGRGRGAVDLALELQSAQAELMKVLP
jgi:adenine C2-methylase RlmN of 23S rRNA A2503 and tRNA A37